MRKLSLLFCTLFVLQFGGKAQTASDSIKTVINGMFTAMAANDSLGVLQVFTPTGQLETIVQRPAGAEARKQEITAFASSVQRAEKGSLREEIEWETVDIRGNLATVTTPYKFYYKGKFLHGGVNHFVLVRTANGWKIQYIIDTRIKG
ncbi:MAG: hypothetical protein EAZ47_02255 [Bacteroidetes bacterium]|nr:MAG: hypothetical protein EAY72_05655 [Bacteroidota bacterium]TAE66626.1 MAG: hypothetical protein EAY68_06005 [Bacteroidota bacterium]TAF96681.1 MAG: hypothetical protein EAZ47_02255 [Bacteroidota bacterium]